MSQVCLYVGHTREADLMRVCFISNASLHANEQI